MAALRGRAGCGQGLAPIRLHRDRVTVALYAHFVAWGWLLYSFYYRGCAPG